MRLGTFFIFLLSFTGMAVPAAAQQTPNRIEVNGEPLWISGSNVAWVDFARDLGPGSARLSEFELAFRTLRDNGGNSMRLWLHTLLSHCCPKIKLTP